MGWLEDLLRIGMGLGLLTLGGELLIRGAMSLSRRLGVSPLWCGLVIVGFGTSMPELGVSMDAVLNDRPAIALGNVIGSNTANVLLILGLCGAVAPLVISSAALRRDGGTALAASLLMALLLGDGALGTVDGALMLTGLIGYLTWVYRSERTLGPASAVHTAEADAVTHLPQRFWLAALAVLAGLACLVGGSQLLVRGAAAIARDWGVSEALIGLTLVAVGTSLPELWTSLMATLRGNADVAVGNILGSNIFNLLGILGVCALMGPLPAVGRLSTFDLGAMVTTAILLLLFLASGRRLNRWEAALLLSGYGAYLGVGVLFFG